MRDGRLGRRQRRVLAARDLEHVLDRRSRGQLDRRAGPASASAAPRATQRGATTRRERRAIPRSIASIPASSGATRAPRPADLGASAGRGGAEALANHVGVELGEVRDADPRAARRELDPQRVGERLDAGLGRASTRRAAAGAPPPRARRSRARSHARGRCGAGRAERVVDPEQVDLDRALEHLRVAADQRQLRRHPGVGDDDVEPAKVLGGRLDRGLDLVAVAHVAHHRERVAALAPRSAPARRARSRPARPGRRARAAAGRWRRRFREPRP